jgi:hypothetical protein
MFIIGMLCGFVIAVNWGSEDTPISYVSNVQEKTYHSDNYMKRYPFEPNFIDVNTSDCNNPQITSLGYIHSIREGIKISWMLCNNTDFDYATVIHANGTKWEKQNKPYDTVQVVYVTGGGGGPSTQWNTSIERVAAGGTGPSTQWNAPIEYVVDGGTGPSTQLTALKKKLDGE